MLPAVLILKKGGACILHKLHDEGADIVMPENPEGIETIPLTELAENYTGQVIFIKPLFKFEKRTEGEGIPRRDTESWFFGTLWRYRNIYTQVLLAALFVNIFTLVGPLFIMNVYDRVVPNNAETTLWVLAIGVLVIYSFDFILRLLRGYLIDVCGKKADIIMASTIFQHVLGIQISNKPKSVGAFANNLREFESLRDFFTSATLTTLIDIPFAILFVIIIWWIGNYLVFVPLLAIPVIFLSAILLEKPLNDTVKQTVQGAAQKNAILVEALSGLEVIKCLGAEGILQKKWEQSVATVAESGFEIAFHILARHDDH